MPPDPSSGSRLRRSRASNLYYPCYGTVEIDQMVTHGNIRALKSREKRNGRNLEVELC